MRCCVAQHATGWRDAFITRLMSRMEGQEGALDMLYPPQRNCSGGGGTRGSQVGDGRGLEIDDRRTKGWEPLSRCSSHGVSPVMDSESCIRNRMAARCQCIIILVVPVRGAGDDVCVNE